MTGQGERATFWETRETFQRSSFPHILTESLERKKKKKNLLPFNVYQIESGTRTVLKCAAIFKMRAEKEEKLLMGPYHVRVTQSREVQFISLLLKTRFST